MTRGALSVTCVLAVVGVASSAHADELWRQNPVNSFGGLSAQDARNPNGLGWFSEVVDNFEAPDAWTINNVEFWGGYATDIPGNTRGFMVRVYDNSDGVVGTLVSTQDVTTFTETEYYSVNFPGIGFLRGYHYTMDLTTPITVPEGSYWISITAILDRGGSANEPQWGWVDAASAVAPVAQQWFFSPGNFTPQGHDVAFVLNGSTGGGGGCDPDINQDGNSDQDDVAYLVNVIGGGSDPVGINPDFNGDGNADQDDISLLVNVVAGAPCP